MGWRFVVALLFAVVVSLFALQNAAVVTIHFVTWDVNISQALVILVSAAVGAIIVMLFDVVRWVRTQANVKSQAKKIHHLESENAKLQQQIEEAESEIKALRQSASSPASDLSQANADSSEQD